MTVKQDEIMVFAKPKMGPIDRATACAHRRVIEAERRGDLRAALAAFEIRVALLRWRCAIDRWGVAQ